MRRAIVLCLIFFIGFQGCSVLISKERERKRFEINSKVKIGAPRSEITELLGKPVKSEDGNVEFYLVCIPKKSDATFNAVMDIAFVGFWELFATPYELATPCELEAEWVITYNEKNKVEAILRKHHKEGNRFMDQSMN
ncbi:hypothetical protein ACFL7M_12240 [Thermodesulfobacteriota bacterium]